MRPWRSRCGVLLAGGASVRFGGQPKGLAPFGSGRLADVALEALRSTCDRVVIAANAPDAELWFPDDTIVRDRVPGRGALSALGTALRAAPGDIVVVCAWDMPFVTARLLDTLAGAVERGASACLPQHGSGEWESLCAAYDSSCAALAETLLDNGERAARTLADACSGEAFPIVAADAHLFFNVNTVDDLARAERMRASQSSVLSA